MEGVRAQKDRTRLGILAMLGATAAFATMAVFVKLLREQGMATGEVMFFRTAPGLPIAFLALRRAGVSFRPKAARPVILRCVFGLGAMTTNFYAIHALSLTQHSVLHLLQPVWVAVFSPFLLAERLRGWAFLALALALSGAMMVLQPDSSDLSIPYLAAIAGLSAALFSGLAHIMVRKATAVDRPELVVFYFMLTISVLSFPALFWSQSQFVTNSTEALTSIANDQAPIWANTTSLLQIGAMAICGIGGQLLMAQAYRIAQAPTIAIVAYSSIPFSVAVDLLVWDNPAGFWALAGAGMLMLAGLVLTLPQQRQAARKSKG